jgi:glycosyltransferase involved in cell wall biosynthesis
VAKVVFCTPSLEGPTAPFIAAMEQSIGAVIGAGWDEGSVYEVGSPYISSARATMLRKALDAKADVIVFVDYDLSWDEGDLLRLLETDGEVVAGTYRFKQDEERYMGQVCVGPDRKPVVRGDGCIRAELIPAGFLKITAQAVDRLMRVHPELCYGPRFSPFVDLFNHGAHDGVWWGEDYAFSRRRNALGGDIWLIPDLNLTHHAKRPDGTFKPYPGNLHQWLLKQGPAE